MRRRGILIVLGVAAFLAAIAAVGVPLALSTSGPGASGPEDAATVPPPATPGGTVAERVAAAARAGARTKEQLAAAAGLPADGPGSLTVAADGTIAATVVYAAPPTEDQLARLGEVARIERVFSVLPGVAVLVEPARLDELAALPGVVSAAPDLAPAHGS